jgi:hypothetical protein
MRAFPSATLSLIAWLALNPLAVVGQTSSTNRTVPKKPATTTDQLTALTQQVQEYQKLLQNPDVTSDTYRKNKIKELWIVASCQVEVLSLPTSVVKDPTFVVPLVQNACIVKIRKKLRLPRAPGEFPQ